MWRRAPATTVDGMTDQLHSDTIAVSAGRPPRTPDGPLNAPIVPASALHADGASGYARDGSPAWAPLEEALGALERGRATCFSSGMGAATAALRHLPRGTRIVAPIGVYRGVRQTLDHLEERGMVGVRWVDGTDTDAVLDACRDADVLWLESPANPRIGVADLPALCGHARERGMYCVVDNTMATPLAQNPLAYGADVAMHSATKWIGGHTDLLLGALIAADDELSHRFVHAREVAGATPGVLEAFLALRGLRSLPVRFERAQASAGELARRLAAHPDVTLVRYPGLPESPDHERAAAFMRGFGAVLAFEVTGGADRAERISHETEVFTHATSFGGVNSSLERRARWAAEQGVPETLMRVSVGLEHVEDLWRDLERALARSAERVGAAVA